MVEFIRFFSDPKLISENIVVGDAVTMKMFPLQFSLQSLTYAWDMFSNLCGDEKGRARPQTPKNHVSFRTPRTSLQLLPYRLIAPTTTL